MDTKKQDEAEHDKQPEPVQRRAIWPDPAKMNFDPDSPDKYNASLRISGAKKRRSTD